MTIDFLKDRAIKYLEAERLEAQAKMESVMRPKGVLLKYKELIRKAARECMMKLFASIWPELAGNAFYYP